MPIFLVIVIVIVNYPTLWSTIPPFYFLNHSVKTKTAFCIKIHAIYLHTCMHKYQTAST